VTIDVAEYDSWLDGSSPMQSCSGIEMTDGSGNRRSSAHSSKCHFWGRPPVGE
jgi:hypothetical protein